MYRFILVKCAQLTVIHEFKLINDTFINRLGRVRHFNDAPLTLMKDVYLPSKSEPANSPLVVLHGLFGSKTNWKSLAKQIAQKSNRKVYALDSRNHGSSPHHADFTILTAADDLRHFLIEENLGSKVTVMGHSMGGVTAMATALQNPDSIGSLVIVDIAPVQYTADTSNVTATIVNAMHKANQKIRPGLNISEARKEFDKDLEEKVPDISMRQFLLTNLVENNGQVKLRVNMEAIFKRFSQKEHSFPPFDTVYEKPTLFICGSESPYVSSKHHPELYKYFPNAKVVYVEGANHWVHADKPVQFLNVLLPFLNQC